MATQRYSVTPHPIETLLTWVKSGEIAIPEIQRPFVWNAAKVRNLLDSLYKGYPVGYLISWRNPTIRLKDGSQSAGKRILIDGQQRITALMVALLGYEVLTKEYQTRRIRIAFNPVKDSFEVTNPAIQKDASWISDITSIFSPDFDSFTLVEEYTKCNPGIDRKKVGQVIQKVQKITNNHVGLIELAEDLDIETVTEIFIRVNSAGSPLSQADFVMSKVSVNENFDGNILRKTIDYFCHILSSPEFCTKIESGDPNFIDSEFWTKIKWLKDINENLYKPTYTDVLRVAFTSQFGRGKLADLVALLSGRNFEKRTYEEEIVEQSFKKLKDGINAFINETHFERFTMILRSSGFLTANLIRNQNAVNFAYIIYLWGRSEKLSPHLLERLVRRWYVMSILTQRYAGSAETVFDFDIRQIASQGFVPYIEAVVENELPDTFWTNMLPQLMDTSSATSPYFIAYQAAQARLGDKGFLSTNIAVSDMLLHKGDKHHIFPRKYLQDEGLSRGRYNQIANFVIAQSEINIGIGRTQPKVYFAELIEQVSCGKQKYGGITDRETLRTNFIENALPEYLLDGEIRKYDDFLVDRRQLMADKIKTWFKILSDDC